MEEKENKRIKEKDKRLILTTTDQVCWSAQTVTIDSSSEEYSTPTLNIHQS